MSIDLQGKAGDSLGLALLLSVLLPLLLLAKLGQDANWDLQNYHLYNAHAWLHGRYAIDIAPAQLQSWHNPLLDVPLYLLERSGSPGAIAGLWLTLPTMLAMFLLLRLPKQLGVSLSSTGSIVLAAMAVTGVAAYSALGSSFNDGFVAAGMLLSIHLLLTNEAPRQSIARVLAAGLVAGMTAGLKLTATPFCLALAAMTFMLGCRLTRVQQLAALLAGGVFGLAMTYGYWGWLLWHWHGNPVFPYFNQLFQSPDALQLPYNDLRFRPATLTDAALVPFRLLFNSQRYSEPTIRDPRLLIGTMAFAFLWLRAPRSEAPDDVGFRRRIRALACFFLVGLLLWVLQYGIYRYVLPLELLSCLALVLAIESAIPSFRRTALVASALLVVAATNHANWGRSAFRQPMVSVEFPALPPHSLIVTGSWLPTSYVTLGMPDDVPVISFYNNFMRPDRCTRMQANAERRIALHSGPIWLLQGSDPSAEEGERLADAFYGLSATRPCRQVTTSLGNLLLCPVVRAPRPPTCLPSAIVPGQRTVDSSPDGGKRP